MPTVFDCKWELGGGGRTHGADVRMSFIARVSAREPVGHVALVLRARSGNAVGSQENMYQVLDVGTKI